MAKKKTTAEKPKRQYTVLIPLTNGATGREYEPGDTVTDGDFPASVIDNWLAIDPPVLEVKS